ncbi:MAG: peptidylprolyl isomerase [Acidimicrobiales bacterium]|nr:peptidylprolyl isomerase [Acidimicrobiales bacterium]
MSLFAIIGIFVIGALVIFRFAGDNTSENAIDPALDPDAVTTTVPGPEISAPPLGGEITGETPCPEPDGSSERVTGFAEAPPMCIDPTKTYVAEVSTTKGNFTIELDAAAAPETVNNFVVLSRYHFYDGVAFHRIIPGFVVQGGDAVGNPPGTGDPGYSIDDELPTADPDTGNSYEIGSLAMANSGANTSGSQFFVVTGDQGVALPPLYSKFGIVIEGLEVIQEIEAVGTAGAGTPTEAVTITSTVITEQ